MKGEIEELKDAITQTLKETKEQESIFTENEKEIKLLKERKENYLKESLQAIEDLKRELRLVNEGVGSKENEV